MYSDEFSAVVALTHAGFARITRAQRGALSRPQSSSTVMTLIFALSLAGCSVGPDYFPEAAPTPTKYKELKGWKLATPRDWVDRGDWWSFYRDPKLAFLLKQVEISNQTVAAAAASYEQARALIREAQAALFPTVSASYTYTRTRTGPKAAFGARSSTGGSAAGPRGAIYTTTFVPQFSGTWDLDVWGKGAPADREQYVRRASQRRRSRQCQAFGAGGARHRLFQFPRGGCAARTARCARSRNTRPRWRSCRISSTAGMRYRRRCRYGRGPGFRDRGAGHQRRRAARAVRALDRDADRPPARGTDDCDALAGGHIPKIPVSVPSTLLERRPDIAAAERTMQEQNALIGVAVAGYFPDISL